MNDQNPRQIAARILSQRLTSGEFTENLLEIALAAARLSPADRGLCHELVCGVVRWQATLDRLIARKTDPARELRPALRNLLRLGLYQIFWLDRIPPHAAVHETVELAKRAGYHSQAGLINAILRGYLREADEIKKILADMKVSQPALGWSHPEWLVERWLNRFGDANTRKLLEWNNTPPKTFARVNTLKFSGTGVPPVSFKGKTSFAPEKFTGETSVPPPRNTGDLLTLWRDEGVDYDFLTRDWTGENLCFELKSHPPLAKLASFRDGWFYLQDPSTLLAPALLDAKPGETILDLCAAPGGKTTFLAQQMNNEGKIIACDISEERLKLIRENCARLGVNIADFSLADGISRPRQKSSLAVAAVCDRRDFEGILPADGAHRAPLQDFGGDGTSQNRQSAIGNRQFDKILIDAPCSNTGVLRRRVDLRWRISPEEISRLQKTQLDLLQLAATKLKPDGILVYSTCSLEPEENTEVVEQFLATHPGFKLETERQLLPFADGVDGAYVAKLKFSSHR